ncbi:MAG: hypothetical protein IKB07_05015 [Lachnospiraceae bacterium]|nr:hypothetical protein [Lachnospiraceae bacterium]
MPPDAAVYLKYAKVKDELDRQNKQIFEAERERGNLVIQLSDLRAIARITQKGSLERQIADKEEEINIRKTGLSNTVRKYGNGKKLMEKSHKKEKLSQNAYSDMIKKRLIDCRRSSITISKRIEGQDK